jgi:uncharacterized membrane protein (UPF0127 family)
VGAAACLALFLAIQPGPALAEDGVSTKGAAGPKTALVTLQTASGPHRFNVEVMTTDAERARGLMYRRTLASDAGMLFVYERPLPLFMWMKNTILSLDMVFFTADGTVHHIERDAEPFSQTPISSEGEVLGVLELNAGTAAQIGLSVGDRLDYPGLSGGSSP